MHVPTQVRVGGQVYRVAQAEHVDGDQAYAKCDLRGLKIELNMYAAPSRQAQSFCHELVEAMNHEYDVQLKHHQVEQLELALYQLLLDNPGLLQQTSEPVARPGED